MDIGAKSDIGRVREENQDAYAIQNGLAAVADGMGGHQAGEVASRLALEALTQAFDPSDDPADSLRQAVGAANQRVWAAAQADPSRSGMGTTLTALYVNRGIGYMAHVGDSRAYLLRGDELRQLTHDHSYVGELVRRGLLSREAARRHPRRNLVTQALGLSPAIEVQAGSVPLVVGDRLILCTDGLSGAVDDPEIRDVILKSPSAHAAAQRLVDQANARGGNDNVTVIILALNRPADVAPNGRAPVPGS